MSELTKLTQVPNRKPADELADIRERIKALETRENVLRAKMIAGECDLTGDEYTAVVSKTRSERIDNDKLKKELGLQFLRPFMKTIQIVYVRVKPKGDPE